MILAAEDRVVEVAVRIDPEVVIGIGRVPEQRLGHGSLGQPSADHVRRVEIQLRLQRDRARQVGLAHQRRVRGDDDEAAAQRVAAGSDAERVVHDLFRFGMLEDVRAVAVDQLGERGEILSRMKLRLPAELDAGRADERDRIEEPRLEAELAGQRGLRFERAGIRRSARGDVLVARHPGPLAVDVFRRTIASIWSMAANPASHTARAWSRPKFFTSPERSRSVTQVTCAVVRPRVHAAAAPAVDDGDRQSAALEQVGRGQSGDAGPDHDGVHRQIAVERRKPRHRRRVLPERLRLKLCRFGHPASHGVLESNGGASAWHG